MARHCLPHCPPFIHSTCVYPLYLLLLHTDPRGPFLTTMIFTVPAFLALLTIPLYHPFHSPLFFSLIKFYFIFGGGTGV